MNAGDSRDGIGRARLPSDSRRIPVLVERSAPDQRRPRVSDEYEEALYDCDRKRAAMYAAMEDISDRWDRLAERISELDVLPAVPIAIDEDEEDSLVTTIDSVTRAGQRA